MSTFHRPSVPVLTDVLQLQRDDEPSPSGPKPDAALADTANEGPELAVVAPAKVEAAGAALPLPPLSADDEKLVMRILEDVQRQVDLMIEHQLRQALAPVIEKLSASLAEEARKAVLDTMRDVVQRAVKQEVARVQASATTADA